MKKYFLFLGALVFITQTTQAQVIASLLLGKKLNDNDRIEFGLEVGMNGSNIRGLDESSSLIHTNLGLYFDIAFKSPAWKLHTGVMPMSTFGADRIPVYPLARPELNGLFEHGEVRRKLSYISLPLLAKYELGKGLFLQAGTQMNFLIGAKDKFYAGVQREHDLIFKNRVTGQYSFFDVGAAMGAGYRIPVGQGMNLSAYYYLGLVNIVKDHSLPKQYNRSIYLVLGIPMGAGAKKK